MTIANIVVLVFIAVTLALLAGVEMRSRKRARRNEAVEQEQEAA
jgi:hypothetical protein